MTRDDEARAALAAEVHEINERVVDIFEGRSMDAVAIVSLALAHSTVTALPKHGDEVLRRNLRRAASLLRRSIDAFLGEERPS